MADVSAPGSFDFSLEFRVVDFNPRVLHLLLGSPVNADDAEAWVEREVGWDLRHQDEAVLQQFLEDSGDGRSVSDIWRIEEAFLGARLEDLAA